MSHLRNLTLRFPPGVSAGPGYWPNALGIYTTVQQENSLQDKNCGLFFENDVTFDPLEQDTFYGSGSGAGPAHLPEVAAAFEKYWVMGEYAFPGGADPNYSMQFAYNTILSLYPELVASRPVLIGYRWLPYSGQYDNELRVLDHHQVTQ
ncbi:MAG TPA: hypothetical protein VHH88_12280 [Verrucomicrobiae bacterium]|nr:hypothetical protein [Verrucomicrobiae bacterium]